VLVTIGTVIASAIQANVFRDKFGFMYVVYWALVSNQGVMLVVLPILFMVLMRQKIDRFIHNTKVLAKKHEFSAEDAMFSYTQLKNALQKDNLYSTCIIAPFLVFVAILLIMGTLMTLWGIDGIISGNRNFRYVAMAGYAAILAVQLCTMALVTSKSVGMKLVISDLMISIAREGGLRDYMVMVKLPHVGEESLKVINAKKTVHHLYVFGQYLETNKFEYLLANAVPLYFSTLIGWGSLIGTLLAAIQTIESTLSQYLYEF
jgi:hypothetical protein